MAILQILKEGEDTLRAHSRAVDEITPRILTLLDDMWDTLHESGGVGLAAPQVGVLRRVVVIECEPGDMIELINPVIVSTSGEQTEVEGCLSIPGKSGIVKRPARVTVEALDRTGKKCRYRGDGLLARCFCHELDHLDGVLYIDKAERMLTQDEIEEMYGEDD